MLCIMNTTVINSGRFVYEAPLLLIGVYVLQLILMIMMAYWGNDLYFAFNKPSRCLIVKNPGADVRVLAAKVNKLQKQYKVSKICDSSDPQIFEAIDQVDTVIFCGLMASERENLVSYCYHKRKEIFNTMEMADIISMGSVQTLFDDTPVMHYSVKGLTFEQRVIKRLMDIFISVVGLVVASPFMLMTALAIKMEDGGPVFYQQPRITYGGRKFNVLKFRSMRVEDGNIHRSATKNDDRITKVGRVIRKFRIDELPQLINILKSDMSVVGPRTEMVENVEKYTRDLPEFTYRQRAKAGLTGMAQIYGKYNTSPSDKLALDLTYIEQYSLLLDIKLILRTVLVLLTPEESTAEFEAEEEKSAA
jgi:exopolysaccharide biosynthesis polyprenyl glycosylphosphotransferase